MSMISILSHIPQGIQSASFGIVPTRGRQYNATKLEVNILNFIPSSQLFIMSSLPTLSSERE